MTADDGAWRDEKRLPLSELSEAMAVYSGDGQVDDATGQDAGAEAEYGVELREGDEGSHAATGDGDPDPTSEEGRRLRPSPEKGLGGPS